jgi:hypothetical protein
LLRRKHSYVPLKKPMNTYTNVMAPNKAPQTDKMSCVLHSQTPRQLAFAAELGR